MSTANAVMTRYAKTKPGGFIRPLDFHNAPRSAVDTALSRLSASKADLLRVAPGLYWKGVNSRYGPGKPSPVDVARARAGDRGVGPTGWSAAHALGLTTQVPATAELTMVGAPPTGVTGVRFHRRNNTVRTTLSYLEVALLEVLRNDLRYIDSGWPTLTRRVRELNSVGGLNLKRVAKAVQAEHSPAARKNFERLYAEVA